MSVVRTTVELVRMVMTIVNDTSDESLVKYIITRIDANLFNEEDTAIPLLKG